MSYQDHLKTCSYCQKGSQIHKPTISIKSASNYRKEKKLTGLAAIVKGISYPSIEPMIRTKGASFENIFKRPGPIEREVKLRELGKLVRG